MGEIIDALSQPLGDLLAQMGGAEPAPGAGSAAALVVMIAAALVQAVASLSRGPWEDAGGAIAQAEAISLRVAPLVELDARRYEAALQVLANPDQVPANERDIRLGEAVAEAAGPPLAIADGAADCAELAALVAERGNQAVRADAVAAATLAEAGAAIAETLLEVNLTMLGGDARIERARGLVRRAAAGRERAAAAIPV